MRALIYGTGSACVTRIYEMKDAFQIVGVIDGNKEKEGMVFEPTGNLIDLPQNIKSYEYDIIIIFSVNYNEIIEDLKNLGINTDCVLDGRKLAPLNMRNKLFNEYIKENSDYRNGIEVGGAGNPICCLYPDVTIRQVDVDDHLHGEDAYTKLGVKLVKVDVIDDGEKLDKFGAASLDFIVACHFIEHCKNPVGTLLNFFDKIRAGGMIFLAIPDKRYTFDVDRELTSIEHLILDYENPGLDRDTIHFFDKAYDELVEEERIQLHQGLEARPHFHVWDNESWRNFILQFREYFHLNFRIECCGKLGPVTKEIICIMVKE